MHEIFEQVESRRQSREENNNSIRNSSTNISVVNVEQVEEEEAWLNTQEDMVPEFNDNNTNSLEVGQK